MTREEYYRLGDAGFFGDERVELLGGEVWRLPPQSPQHFTTGEAVTDTLLSAFGKGFDARRQGPLCLGNDSEPEPDVVIVPGTWRDYVEQHPTPSKVRLLVEVSDATLRKDRTTKAQDYAQAGIADYSFGV